MNYVWFGPLPGRNGRLHTKKSIPDPESICLFDLNYEPTGHTSFFAMAWFPSPGLTC